MLPPKERADELLPLPKERLGALLPNERLGALPNELLDSPLRVPNERLGAENVRLGSPILLFPPNERLGCVTVVRVLLSRAPNERVRSRCGSPEGALDTL